MLFEVESVERGDQIYPPGVEDGYPQEIQALLGNVEAIWDTFFSFVEADTSFTSYVMVSD